MGNSNKKVFWQLILVFLTLAILSLLPQLAKQTMYMNSWDVPFHLSRMYEFEKGFQLGKWFPDVSAYTFGQNGYGVNLFYGYSFTYLVALIYFVTHHAVTAVLIGYVILLTTAMGINFYAGTQFFSGVHARSKAFAFSVLYVLAPVTFGEIQVRGLPGELIGILFFPAVLAAFYSIMFTNRKRYIFAGIVSAIVVTNHVLSALLLVLVITVMFAVFCYQKQATPTKLLQLVKAGVLAVLLSAFYVVPFVQQLVSDKIAGANAMWGTVSLWDSIASSVNNQATLNWTAIPVGAFVFIMSIVIVLGLFYRKAFSNRMKKISGWLAISLIAVFYMPTEILAKTPLHVFQMMGRFYPVIMLLALLFVVEGLDNFFEANLLKSKTMYVLFAVGISLAIFSAWRMQAVTYYKDTAAMGNYQKGKHAFPKTVSNHDFEYQIAHYYQLPLGSKDYLGKERVKFVNDYQVASWGDTYDATRVYVDGQLTKLKLTHTGYVFQVANIPYSAHEVLLPMTNYIGWQARGNAGQILPITRVKGKIAVAPQGSTKITLTYHKTKLHQSAIAVSAMTVAALVLWRGVYIIKRRK
ncbi:6-pyruvoyl-tetrahydropterin synthase-related protein [uncultured Leuconostoc sp.]|uniref:6-pyruvoyl-tetrahydropterin synthase-related protein n=1 Tax=uncultured Leuconostoc sp. TaxID=173262 RepID=UPI0025FECE2C|nr:6-pyruvoyl-tetrahydropterin synthase-related protein [uncultured Leuconostoc sp.]